MPRYAYLACFVANYFITNGVPHFVYGVSDERFITPFASPTFVGDSSPLVNISRALFNFFAEYVLIAWLRPKVESSTLAILMTRSGILVTSVALALYFEHLCRF